MTELAAHSFLENLFRTVYELQVNSGENGIVSITVSHTLWISIVEHASNLLKHKPARLERIEVDAEIRLTLAGGVITIKQSVIENVS